MTIVDDMSTTRKAARYKGSRPLAKENGYYADPATDRRVGQGVGADQVGIIQALG